MMVHRALTEAVASAPTAPAVAPAADAVMVLRPARVAGQLHRLPAVHQYVVQPGDTVPTICARAGISVDTLMQVNHLPGVDALTVGQPLLVPPVDGSMVPVAATDTLPMLAARVHADPAVLMAVNGLGPTDPLPKQLFVPALQVDQLLTREQPQTPAPLRQDFVRFTWPTHGTITQYFWQYHPGIDIANDVGTPEVAADAGRVIFAGWGDYGLYVEIDHGNGFTTVYGHMSAVLVSQGQPVSQGQLIGLMGATGRATGPHLHFEIRYHQVPVDPMLYLPPT
jgi:murein DD-endopeptidase MepM/ murein hydrolase activator NlpD